MCGPHLICARGLYLEYTHKQPPSRSSKDNLPRDPAPSTFLGTGVTLVAEMHRQRVAEAGSLMAEYAPEPPFPTGSIAQSPADLVALLERGLSGFVAEAVHLKIYQAES